MRGIISLAMVLALPMRLAAQWQVRVEGVVESISGVTGAVESGVATFGIHRPTWIGLRVESPGARVRWSAGLSYAAPSLALDAPEVTIIEHQGATTATALRAGVIVRLAQLQPGVALRVEAGPVLEWWSFEGSTTRLRGGGEIGLSLTVGLGGRFSGALGGFLGVTPVSPLEPADLPEGIEPRSAWRRALRGSVGLAL